MKIRYNVVAMLCALGAVSFLAGCTPAPPPTPTPDPNATPAMRSNNPAVLNDPNVPEEIKRQIRGGPSPSK